MQWTWTPLPVDVADGFWDIDLPLRTDLLHDGGHREQRCQVIGTDRLARTRMDHRCRWFGQVGDNVVPGLGYLVLIQNKFHTVGHCLILTIGS